MRSALYIGSKQNNPLTRTQIPSCASPNGMPFCFEYSGEVTQWQLVKDGEEYGYDLDVSWLTNDGKYIYYNGDVDLLEYLTGLGYDARAGRYYYSFRLDGYDDALLLGVDVFSNTASVNSTKSYGIWDCDIYFNGLGSLDIYPTFEESGVSYRITITPGTITFYVDSEIKFQSVNNIIGERFNLRITRNSLQDEYIIGDIGTWALYVNADLLIADSEGSNPFIENTLTTSSKFFVSISRTNGIYSVDNFHPSDFISEVSGGVRIIHNPTGGTIKQSNLFQLECEDTRPITPGDFNNDFSNDFF